MHTLALLRLPLCIKLHDISALDLCCSIDIPSYPYWQWDTSLAGAMDMFGRGCI